MKKTTTTTAKPASITKSSTTQAPKKTLEATAVPKTATATAKETAIKTPVTEAPVVPVPVPVETAVKKTTPEPSIAANVTKTSAHPKQVKKAPVVKTGPVISAPELAMNERIGLTAGSIWHYLAENGGTSVVKLADVLPEEAEVVQRSIGWLAAEGKITLAVIDQVEVIVLKD